ncbi:MAG: hypothetical protein WCK89_16395, partial [bacterium]
GAFAASPSAYGTFDQGGNLWQWNEANISGLYRGVRGGSFYFDGDNLHASSRNSYGSPSGDGSTAASSPRTGSGQRTEDSADSFHALFLAKRLRAHTRTPSKHQYFAITSHILSFLTPDIALRPMVSHVASASPSDSARLRDVICKVWLAPS